nr:hypothetical protein [uncultured Rhodopila sp.]
MAQAAFDLSVSSDNRTTPGEAAETRAPAIRGLVVAVLLSLPIWAGAVYLLVRLL